MNIESIIYEKRVEMVLGAGVNDKTVRTDFLEHSDKLKVVLEEMKKKKVIESAASNTKSFLTSEDSNSIRNRVYDNMIRWDAQDSEGAPVGGNPATLERLENVVRRLNSSNVSTPDEVRNSIFENVIRSKDAIAIGKANMYRVERLPDYAETSVRLSSIFLSLSKYDFSFIWQMVQYDENSVLLLLTPALFCKLGFLLTLRILPNLHVTGSLIDIIGKVASSRAAVQVAASAYTTLSLTTRVSFVGIGSTLLSLVLYSGVFRSTGTLLLAATPSLYTGIEGKWGEMLTSFRFGGSRFLFDIARTMSTFSNAAIAGFMEPKGEAISRAILEAVRVYKEAQKK